MLLFVLGQIIETNGSEDDNPMFNVICLHGAESGSLGQFVWPTWENTVKGLPKKDILCKTPHPIALSNRHIGHIDAFNLALMSIFHGVF